MKWKLFSENSIPNMSNTFPSLIMSTSYNFPTAAKVSDTLTRNYSLMTRVYFIGIQSVRNTLQIFSFNLDAGILFLAFAVTIHRKVKFS